MRLADITLSSLIENGYYQMRHDGDYYIARTPKGARAMAFWPRAKVEKVRKILKLAAEKCRA